MTASPEPCACRSCERDAVRVLLDLGAQPVSSRLVTRAHAVTERHPLVLGQCTGCGLLQLVEPMPITLTRPRTPGVRYTEPEAHLSAVCERLTPLLGAAPLVYGLSWVDDSLLARLEARSGAVTRRLDPAADWGVHEACAQLETLQARVTVNQARAIAARHGPADLVVARRVFEHAHHPRAFLEGLKELVKPGGAVLVEVPANEGVLATADHAFLWEEHVQYFTAPTFARALGHAGLDGRIWRFPAALEDSLVAVAARATSIEPADAAPVELARGRAFAERLAVHARDYRERFAAVQARGGRIAVFGAGHLAVKFVNFYGVGDLVDCFVDDDPGKVGHWVPGCGLPVVPSADLHRRGITLCLLSVHPEREAAVVARLDAFREGGGAVRSIFRASDIGISTWNLSSA